MSDRFQYHNVEVDLPEILGHSLHEGPGGSASMKAAANPDINVLRAVLARRLPFTNAQAELQDFCGVNSSVERPGQDPINTPLLQAIRSQLPQNVELLLKSGANPNGIHTPFLAEYQTFFLRFRPMVPDMVDIDGDVASREMLLGCMDLEQTAAITVEEIEERTALITPFWLAPMSLPTDFWPGANEMHAVIAAARQQSTDLGHDT